MTPLHIIRLIDFSELVFLSTGDNAYNVTHPHDCSGIMYVGLCIKAGIDEVCNPEPEDDNDNGE
jgi:hypothetical protein